MPLQSTGLPDSNPIRPWHWLTILSCDAPIVTLVWQDFLARLTQVELGAAHRAVLGLSVWLAYMADRWLDGRQLPVGGTGTARHAFAQRFTRPIAVVWLLVLLGTVLLSLRALARDEIIAGLALTAAVAGYLAACQLRPPRERFGGLKELLVAALVTAGAALFVLVRSPLITIVHGLALVSLLLLCLLNCAAVSCWERTVDRRQGQPSLAERFGLEPKHLQPFAVGLLAIACILGGVTSEPPVGRLALAAAITALGLLILIRRGAGIGLETRRLLADATLLSPAVLIPFY